jgi:hypothetical protein
MQRRPQRSGARRTVDIDRAAAFAVVAAVLTLALGAYARHVSPVLTDVPLIGPSGRLLYALMLVSLVGFAYQAHRVWDEVPVAYTPYPPAPTAWILPTLTMLGGLLLVVRYHDWAVIAMAGIIVGSGVYAALTVRASLTGTGVVDSSTAQAIHSVLTLVVALIALSQIYGYRMRTIYSAPAVFLVALLLLLQIHDGVPSNPVRRVAYALVGSFVVAEVVWPLNYWPPSGWFGGGVLAVVFLGYALISRAQLRQRLTQTRVMQYAALTVAMFAVIVVLAR